MTKKPLSVNEVLRHAHHDFLNELQLIKMHLALDDVNAANQVVDNVSAKFNQFFRINGLYSEQFIEWLHTCEWRFPSINITIESDISDRLPSRWDRQLSNFFESTLQHVHHKLDPMCDQNCELYIMSTEDKLEILFTLSGKWEFEEFTMPLGCTELIVATEHYSDTLWRFSVIGSKEGI